MAPRESARIPEESHNMEAPWAVAYLRSVGDLSRNVRLYLVSVALTALCNQGFYAVLFNLYLLRLGFDLEFIGLMNGLSWVAIVVCTVPAGKLAGRWGARRMMTVGMTVMALGFLLPPLAEFVPVPLQAGWLLTMWSLGGAGWTACVVGARPYLMAATRPDQRDHAFSVQSALPPLTGFIGSLLAGALPGALTTPLGVTLDHPAPYRYPLLFAGLLLIPGVLALLATGEVEDSPARTTVAEAGRGSWDLILPLVMFAMLCTTGEVAVYTFFNVYMDDGLGAPTVLIGSLAAIGQLLAGAAALASPLLMRRWGVFRTVVWGSLGVVLATLPLVLVASFPAAGLGFVAAVAVSSATKPALGLFQQTVVPPDRRATTAAADVAALSLSGAGLSLGGAYLITAMGYRSLFLVASGLSATGALLFWAHFRVPRGELAHATTAARDSTEGTPV